MKIITAHIHPPIPLRAFDWVAHRDGMEEVGPCGHGKTEEEAIENLLFEEEVNDAGPEDLM